MAGWKNDVDPSKADLAELFDYACRRNHWYKPTGDPSMRQLSIRSTRRDGTPYSEGLIHSMLRRPSEPTARALEAIATAAACPDLTALDLMAAVGLSHDPAIIAAMKRKVERARRYNAGDERVRLTDEEERKSRPGTAASDGQGQCQDGDREGPRMDATPVDVEATLRAIVAMDETHLDILRQIVNGEVRRRRVQRPTPRRRRARSGAAASGD